MKGVICIKGNLLEEIHVWGLHGKSNKSDKCAVTNEIGGGSGESLPTWSQSAQDPTAKGYPGHLGPTSGRGLVHFGWWKHPQTALYCNYGKKALDDISSFIQQLKMKCSSVCPPHACLHALWVLYRDTYCIMKLFVTYITTAYLKRWGEENSQYPPSVNFLLLWGLFLCCFSSAHVDNFI